MESKLLKAVYWNDEELLTQMKLYFGRNDDGNILICNSFWFNEGDFFTI